MAKYNVLKVELNSKGVQELLHSVGKMTCMRLAEDAARRCGTGYVAESRTYSERSGAVIKTNSAEAVRDNAANNTILKSIGSG